MGPMNDRVKAAAALLRSGNIADAEALLAEVPADAADIAVLNLSGVLKGRQGKHQEAIALFQRALSLSPGNPQLLVGLGNAYGAMGNDGQALRCYAEAKIARPHMAEAHFNEAQVYRGQGDYFRAAVCFRKAALAAPTLFPASQGVVDCLASLAKSRDVHVQTMPGDSNAVSGAPAASTGHAPSISIIICSLDAEKFRNVTANYSRLLAACDFEIIGIHDAKSLCEAYNRGIDRSRGEIVVFSHDDIEILCGNFAQILFTHMQVCDIAGVAGTNKLTGPLWSWSGYPHSHAWVTQRTLATPQCPAQYRVAVDNLRQVSMLDAQALDGVFFAVKRAVFDKVRFDESFDGFHFYDLDFTFRAYRAGLRLGIFGDIVLAHDSEGRNDAAWHKYAGAFLEKYPELKGPTGAEQPRYRYAALLDSREQVMAFHSCLSRMVGMSEQGEDIG